ncbi:glial cell line-derived neurotrophic factor-like [Hippocampus zosterae]|uniref:glial cell line-derived neurotrophic factor-like n=1 Tax=Hippocampus zosterae TaxID=109293 RepID=UPI00223CDED1|nr:glial cell line-derived neurotrophic factor-like [Hippocampus zosterae]
MTLWHSLTTCLIALGVVHAGPEPPGLVLVAEERPLESPPLRFRPSFTSQGISESQEDVDHQTDAYIMEEAIPADFDELADLVKVTVSRIRGSPSESTPTQRIPQSNQNHRIRSRRERRTRSSRKRMPKARKAGGKRAKGCSLQQVHLNVTDLGLGYHSGEEMIFRYCAGPCRKSETNYDKILRHLGRHGRLPAKDAPPQTCCRPVAFDDNLSFLDDNLVYHTLRKHSARKCACV